MNIKIMKLGDSIHDHIVPEYGNDNAWFASILIGKQKIDIKEVDGKLELHCPTGRLIIQPETANSIKVIPVQL